HAGAMKLGGKERIENLIGLLRGQAHAGIADGYEDFLVFQQPRINGELPCSIHALHRINAVHDQVHHHLLQLHAISHDLRQVSSQIHRDKDVLPIGLALQDYDHLSHDFVYFHQLTVRAALLEELAYAADNFRRTSSIGDDSR